ncbi:MAG: 4Fe-4S dicluster domain-containing protein [Eggerthellaceae bacterium]|nr:4Fe-4S dicluster domain-containing protein [Eggerthellaceae bacterium]
MQESVALSRRDFMKGGIAIGSCVIFGATAATLAAGKANADDADSLAGVQYGFLVDLNKCVGCENCVAACRKYNHLSEDTPNRRKVTKFTNSRQEDVYVSTSCMHCAEPSCERVCPSGAISKGNAGIVSTDKDRCIGCKYCFQACPYGVPHYNSVAMDKCDCCLDAGIVPGQTPYCVQNCKFGALRYGSMEELKEFARGNAVPIGTPNDPSCLVIGEGR